MAASTSSPSGSSWLVDPNRANNFTVVLGDSLITRDQRGSRSYASVTYNHKPSQSCTSRRTKIKPSPTSESDVYDLTISDNDDKPSGYSYRGRRHSSKSSIEPLVLVYSSTKQQFVLEKLGAEFDFNITSTPWETDPNKLRKTYQQLSANANTTNTSSTSPVGADDDITPEEDNPYDYRHYLDGWGRNNFPSESERDATSTANRDTYYLEAESDQASSRTPCPVPRLASGQQQSSSNTKSKNPSKPNSKISPQASRTKVKHPEPRADFADDESSSSSNGDDNDDGGLTIEFDPDTKSGKKSRTAFKPVKKHAHSLHPHNLVSRAGGPISLRSAASSMSPASVKCREKDSSDSDGDEDAEGESESDGHRGVNLPIAVSRKLYQEQEQQSRRQAEESSASDVDDDDTYRPTAPSPIPPQEIEEELDLEAELAVALGEPAGAPLGGVIVPITKAHESESESEEE